MDSTPQPLKPSASKLPIKRKILDQPHHLLTPKLESIPTVDYPLPATITTVDFDDPTKPPPFKFHRIWTETDEIRFLHGLLDSSWDGLCFPRDLPIFYDRFSTSMTQPYTKSQLSEKLRRLRKKFRVISSRLSRGLDASLLSSHDRSLYDLSRKLWSPDFASSSPFGIKNASSAAAADGHGHGNLAGVKVSFSPDLPLGSSAYSNPNHSNSHSENDNMCEVNVDYDLGGCGGDCDVEELGGEKSKVVGVNVVARSVLDVFDECLKEVFASAKKKLGCSDNRQGLSGKEKDFQTRWREQRLAELDVFARRLRLVLENSVNGNPVSK